MQALSEGECYMRSGWIPSTRGDIKCLIKAYLFEYINAGSSYF